MPHAGGQGKGNKGQRGGKCGGGKGRRRSGGAGGARGARYQPIQPAQRFSAQANLADATLDPQDLATYTARRNNLDQFLQENYQFGLRDDSVLSYRWCLGQLDPMWQDMTVVAHEIACIQTIHHATPYNRVCQEVLPEMAGALAASGIPWKEAWRRVRAFGVPALKIAAILSCEDVVPEMVEAEAMSMSDESDSGETPAESAE